MCLIAKSKNGFQGLPRQFWRAACASFSDGLGVMYHHDGQLFVTKLERYDTDTVLSIIQTIPQGAVAALHLRAATYGSRCGGNLHPHVLQQVAPAPLTLAVMHNGSIRNLKANPVSGPSDTQLLVSQWLRELMLDPTVEWHSASTLDCIKTFIGPNNRLVLLDGAGVWRVVGEELGFMVGDTWLSNKKVAGWV